jgi:hypothetical protein
MKLNVKQNIKEHLHRILRGIIDVPACWRPLAVRLRSVVASRVLERVLARPRSLSRSARTSFSAALAESRSPSKSLRTRPIATLDFARSLCSSSCTCAQTPHRGKRDAPQKTILEQHGCIGSPLTNRPFKCQNKNKLAGGVRASERGGSNGCIHSCLLNRTFECLKQKNLAEGVEDSEMGYVPVQEQLVRTLVRPAAPS